MTKASIFPEKGLFIQKNNENLYLNRLHFILKKKGAKAMLSLPLTRRALLFDYRESLHKHSFRRDHLYKINSRTKI